MLLEASYVRPLPAFTRLVAASHKHEFRSAFGVVACLCQQLRTYQPSPSARDRVGSGRADMGWLQPWTVAAAALALWVSGFVFSRHSAGGPGRPGFSRRCLPPRAPPSPLSEPCFAPSTDRWVANCPICAPPHTACLQLLAVGYRLAWRWRLRAIPLVRPMPFFFGHLK